MSKSRAEQIIQLGGAHAREEKAAEHEGASAVEEATLRKLAQDIGEAALTKLAQNVGEARLAELGSFVALLVKQGLSPDEIVSRAEKEFEDVWQVLRHPIP